MDVGGNGVYESEGDIFRLQAQIILSSLLGASPVWEWSLWKRTGGCWHEVVDIGDHEANECVYWCVFNF